jgi:hypothetical protein
VISDDRLKTQKNKSPKSRPRTLTLTGACAVPPLPLYFVSTSTHFCFLNSIFSHHNLLQLPPLLHPVLHCLRQLHLSTFKTSHQCSARTVLVSSLFKSSNANSFSPLLSILTSFSLKFLASVLFFTYHAISLILLHFSHLSIVRPPSNYSLDQPQFSTPSHPYTLRHYNVFRLLPTLTTCPLLSTSTSFCSFFPLSFSHLLCTINIVMEFIGSLLFNSFFRVNPISILSLFVSSSFSRRFSPLELFL